MANKKNKALKRQNDINRGRKIIKTAVDKRGDRLHADDFEQKTKKSHGFKGAQDDLVKKSRFQYKTDRLVRSVKQGGKTATHRLENTRQRAKTNQAFRQQAPDDARIMDSNTNFKKVISHNGDVTSKTSTGRVSRVKGSSSKMPALKSGVNDNKRIRVASKTSNPRLDKKRAAKSVLRKGAKMALRGAGPVGVAVSIFDFLKGKPAY